MSGSKLKRALPVSLLTAILAFVVYGAWAAFVNSEHGQDIWLRAGLGQGTYAFFSTWVVTGLARKVLSHIGPTVVGIAFSFVSSFSVMLSFPLVIHRLLGTVDVLEAILPGLIWSSIYIAIVIKLSLRQTTINSTEFINTQD